MARSAGTLGLRNSYAKCVRFATRAASMPARPQVFHLSRELVVFFGNQQ